ncbi:MAG: GumC family protein [Opitutaceae bacterium]
MSPQMEKQTIPAAKSSGSEQLMSVREVVHIILHRWQLSLLCGLGVALAFAAIMLTRPKIYEATATLVVELDVENIMDVQQVVETGVKNHNLLVSFMNTHIDRIRSAALSEMVYLSLDPDIQKALLAGSEEATPQAGAQVISKLLDIVWEAQSQTLIISISYTDAQVAMEIANAYLAQYIRYNSDLRLRSTTEAVSFLELESGAMREHLENAEKKLQVYRVANDLATLDDRDATVPQKIKQLNEAVTDARVRLVGVQSRLNQIKTASDDLDVLMNVPFVGGREDVKEIYAQLQELRREYKVLDGVYLSKHPKVIENKASQEAVSESLWTSIEQARNEVAVEYATISGELEDLEQLLHETEQASLDIQNRLIEYRVLERNAEALREAYDMVSTRYTETSMAQRMNLNSIRPLDHASIPQGPVSPNLIKISLASCFIAGFFFVGVPLVFEIADTRIKSFSEVESFTTDPLLGDIRHFTAKSFGDISQGVFNKVPVIKEPFLVIYSALRLRTNVGKQPISFLVTSSIPGEGKSSVAANLAAIIANQHSRVLLVDCDLRRPAIADAFGLAGRPGLVQWYGEGGDREMNTLSLKSLGVVEMSPRLHILPAGAVDKNPTELLGDPDTTALFAKLKQQYDVIIYDTPPVGVFPDALIVADFADKSVFVVRQFSARKNKVDHAIYSLDASNAPTVGVIFNGIKNEALAVGYSTNRMSYAKGFEKDAGRYRDYYNRPHTHSETTTKS